MSGNLQSEIIAVAMSGGVDSSVAAVLLKEQGCNIIGVTARLTQEFSRCCSTEDILLAKKACEKLGVQHHVVEMIDEFSKQIVDYFISEYVAGRTPSPCVWCNKLIKFGALMDKARLLGATKLATGHYARLTTDKKGGLHLRKGLDTAKDQTYFLSLLTQDQLADVIFPLGEMRKEQVVRTARERNLDSANRPESQELCFITEGTHGDWIDLRSLKTKGKGKIIDPSGKKLGEHSGIHHYTVGQRKGLGIAAGQPVFITSIDAESNTISVGTREAAMKKYMEVQGISWISGTKKAGEFRCQVQIRYNHTPADSTITVNGDRLKVTFDEPQFAVTPGQLAAFYDGDEILGGGWIV